MDSIFTDLYHENKNGEIISLLKELTKSFDVAYILETLCEDFEELANLYELLGLSISIEVDKVIVTTCMSSNGQRIVELFSVESWLKQNHKEVYDSYEAAIDAYLQSAAEILTVLRFMMTVAFCLYDFRINSLKCNILLREYSLNILAFPLI